MNTHIARVSPISEALSAVCLLAPAFALPGCGFFASAGEIPLAAEQGIPRVAQEVAFPNIDELTGGDLGNKIGATDPETGKPLVAGIPSSLKKTTLAHIQGLLSLAGVCRRTIRVDELVGGGADPAKPTRKDPPAEGAAASPVSNVAVTITNCTGDPACSFVCGDWQGIEIEAGADIQLLTAAQATELANQLAKAGGTRTAADALVALRFFIYQIDLFQAAADADKDEAGRCNKKTTTGTIEAYRRCTTDLLDDFELVLQHAELPEGETDRQASETKVITFEHFRGISPRTPKRFVVDANAAVTAEIKRLLVAQKRTSVRVVQRLRVKRPDLLEMNFDGAGLILDLQPEIVVSVTELIKSLGGVN